MKPLENARDQKKNKCKNCLALKHIKRELTEIVKHYEAFPFVSYFEYQTTEILKSIIERI